MEEGTFLQLQTSFEKSRGWMKFIGIICIIAGTFYCITIIGAVIGWIPIWMGILLLKAAERTEMMTMPADEQPVLDYLAGTSKFFRVYGIFTMICLVFMIAMLLMLGTMFLVGGKAMLQKFKSVNHSTRSSFDVRPEHPDKPKVSLTIEQSITEEDITDSVVNQEKIQVRIPYQGQIKTAELQVDYYLLRTLDETVEKVAVDQKDQEVFRNAVQKELPGMEKMIAAWVVRIPEKEQGTEAAKVKLQEAIKKEINNRLRKVDRNLLQNKNVDTDRVTDVLFAKYEIQ